MRLTSNPIPLGHGAPRVTPDPGQNASGSAKTLPRASSLTRKYKRKHKGQKVTPSMRVTDAGMAARQRLYSLADQDYRDINHSWTVVWLQHRLKEYCEIHGYASAGVCAALERAAEQYADSDFLRATAASSGSKDLAQALHQASKHSQLARSHELAAWELAAREGAAKKLDDGTNIAGMSNRNGKLALALREHPAGQYEPESMTQVSDDPWVESDPVGGGGQKSDPASTFRPPGGVEGRGPLSPSSLPQTDSPSPPIPKPPLYTYCEGCSRNFKERVCPRCGPQAPAGLSESESSAIVGSEDA